jgi:ABC-2 type transport system ATP-binding protein
MKIKPSTSHQALGTNSVEVNNLVKRFGSFTAVDKISFDIKKGEIFGFLGPNGSGKSTTIRMLCGVIQPTEGSARVLGYDVEKNPEDIKSRIGYMSQAFSLYEDLTVDENLEFYGGIYGVEGKEFTERRKYILNMANLKGHEKVLTKNLAVGWKQRLALGCAIVHSPKMLFLDEPTGGVDPISRRHFWELLYEMAEDGVTLFVTTHYMDEAEHCQNVAFIYEGKIIAIGSPSKLKSTYMKDETIEITTSDNESTLSAIEKLDFLDEAYIYGSTIHANTASKEKAVPLIEKALVNQDIAITEIRKIDPSLEDVFVFLASR